MRQPSFSPRVLGALSVFALFAIAPTSRAGEPGAGECAPPRTLVALLPLADRSDRTWELLSGMSPSALVGRALADSLQHVCGRRVIRVPFAAEAGTPPPVQRAVDDEQALRAVHRGEAEVIVTGTVSVFTHEDSRDAGKFSRWGFGAPDAHSRVRVSVTLRVLDAHDGNVIIETTAARDRAGRGTATVGETGADARDPSGDRLVNEVLGEVLGDLVSTIGQRLDASWQARVVMEGRGTFELDAGSARGLFAGERLDVWRPGIELFDQDLLHVGNDTRIGSVVVTQLDGRGRAHARLLEGDARMGDLVRPCSGASGSAMSMRR